MDHNFWIDKFHNVIYKKDKLVYIPTLKNACTFYRSLSVYNNWSVIRFNQIDWDNDHVFSFISDPVIRYFKGLAQDLFNVYFEEDKQVFYELLKYSTKTLNDTTFVMTVHSTPLTITLGEAVHKIDWIPIHESIDNYSFYKKLCSSYNIQVRDDSSSIERHESIPQKKAFFQELFKNVDNIQTNLFYNLTLSQDINLYRKVLENFNPLGNTWNEISWLK